MTSQGVSITVLLLGSTVDTRSYVSLWRWKDAHTDPCPCWRWQFCTSFRGTRHEEQVPGGVHHAVISCVHGISTSLLTPNASRTEALAQFVVPGLAGMSGLISSWRPGAHSAWTFRAYRQFMSSSSPPLACSGFKNDVYFMRGKSRDIPCGSPLEDDQVVSRCLLTISAFCSRLRGVVLVFIALFGPIRWCWRDTRVGALIRSCGQVICTLSAFLVLVCLPAYGYRKLDPFPCLL